MPSRYVVLAVGFFFLLGAGASPTSVAADWIPPGPVVGAKFDNRLQASDEAGVARDLGTLYGKRGVAVFFVRSADWCPFCKRQLVDVSRLMPRFRELGLNVVSVSVDSVEKIARFHAEQSIGFTMLADPQARIVEALGIRDAQYPTGSLPYGVPHPMIFVIDRKGIVRARFAEQGYRTRPDLEAVLTRAAEALRTTG